MMTLDMYHLIYQVRYYEPDLPQHHSPTYEVIYLFLDDVSYIYVKVFNPAQISL